ncbi:BON domain-containing protein [Burkholderia diffusa]|uniref:BON domain-containing protein n=1 Tax=Burkholderia diffusa TaxID=488732 RepID=UPI00075F437E|nr:BON domain-containing protein [Burkholderia diffusa]KVG31096.1 transporter [Burkholderia diffusa]
MKTIDGLRVALGVAILTASLGAWAQASMTAAASAVVTSGPTNAKAVRQANRALRRKVYAAFGKHKEIDAGNISVVAKNGAITLSGTVAEASQIDTAGQLARGVPGVTSVTNKIMLQRPLGQ